MSRDIILKVTWCILMMGCLGVTQTVIYIDPPRIPEKSVGQQCTLKVRIRNAAGVFGWQIAAIYFNPNVLEGVSVVEDSFLKYAHGVNHSTWWSSQSFDNVNGFLDATLCIQMGTDSGGVGDGSLMKMIFNVIDTGSSVLDIIFKQGLKTYLLDNSGHNIPLVCLDGFYGDETVPPTSSFPVNTGSGHQIKPAVAWNNSADDFLVVWEEYSYPTGNSVVRGQRVSSAGSLLGSSLPIVGDAFFYTYTPSINWNGSNYLLSYTTRFSGSIANYNIEAAVVSATGSVVSGAGVCSAVRYQGEPAIAWNGTNHLVVWDDYRNGWGNPDIYGQRISSNGTLLGNNFRICEGDSNSLFPRVASDGSNYLVIWTRMQKSSNVYGLIYGQRVDANGNLIGSLFQIASAGAVPDIAFDGTNYLVVYQKPTGSVEWNIYGRRVSSSGFPVGAEFAINTASSDQIMPKVIYEQGSGRYLVSWVDEQSMPAIYCQRINPDGTFFGDPFLGADASYQQIYTAIASGDYSSLITWQDYRNGTDYDIWGSIIYEPIPPNSPYITEAEKAGNDLKLYWNKINEDTLGNMENMDYYVIYRSASPDFIPGTSDSIASVVHPETSFIDIGVLSLSQDYYYLVKAVDAFNNRSTKSNMGYKFNKFFNENASATDKNWVSLPWHSGYSAVSNLTTDLSASGNPLEKITNLRDDQNCESWIWDPDFFEWGGENFAIEPGCGYEMVTIKDTTLVFVGSNNPDGLINLNWNPSATDKNWVSIPYNAVYATVSDITDEYSPAGNPLEKITNLRDDQNCESWIWDPDFMEWGGANFAIQSGRAYEFVAIVDTTWNPAEYTNDGGFWAFAGHRIKDSDVVLCMGKDTEPKRAPAWFTSIDSKLPVKQHNSEVMRLRTSELPNLSSSSYRDVGTSHIVRCHLGIKDFENLIFTAYRPCKPFDVLTEEMIGSCVMKKGSRAAIWFDVANFRTPWKDKEEVILIIEATKQGRGYFAVVNFSLNDKVDIQELDDVTLKPVIEGGYETAYGSGQQGEENAGRTTLDDLRLQIYPNPFSEKTEIRFTNYDLRSTMIRIYDATGRLVKTFSDILCNLNNSVQSVSWDGTDDIGRGVFPGVYFIQLNAENYQSQHKVIFVH